jgi:hypothetical protein
MVQFGESKSRQQRRLGMRQSIQFLLLLLLIMLLPQVHSPPVSWSEEFLNSMLLAV